MQERFNLSFYYNQIMSIFKPQSRQSFTEDTYLVTNILSYATLYPLW